jgi:hypothetical protein
MYSNNENETNNAIFNLDTIDAIDAAETSYDVYVNCKHQIKWHLNDWSPEEIEMFKKNINEYEEEESEKYNDACVALDNYYKYQNNCDEYEHTLLQFIQKYDKEYDEDDAEERQTYDDWMETNKEREMLFARYDYMESCNDD